MGDLDRGCEIFKTIKPRMDQMKLHIDQVAATREKEVVSTKEGYLLHMNEKNRVKNKWMRNWYVLRDGLFYCKVGKVLYPLLDLLVLMAVLTGGLIGNGGRVV
jgi:hypothetical protein